jgi:hypothetical protein
VESKGNRNYKYELAISFAGEDRQVVENIAHLLKERGISVFYDDYEKADLWGKDLYEYLADVYSTHARYCIMLISEHYSKKLWTNHERRNAQERAFKAHEEYILPVRLDDTAIPGVRDTIGYIDLRNTSVEDLVDLIEQKLGKGQVSKGRPKEESASEIPMPKIKKKFTDRDKDKYLKDAFVYIKEYFNKALVKLEKSHAEVETDFTAVHDLKFLSKIYVNGATKCECKIWLGSFGSTRSIKYLEGHGLDIDDDGTYNEYFSIEDDGYEIFIKPTFIMSFGNAVTPKPQMARQDSAEYLWRRFISHLEQ